MRLHALFAVLAAAALTACASQNAPPPDYGQPSAYQEPIDTYSRDEMVEAAADFFGVTAEAAASALERVFADLGRPVGYIAGEEVSAAAGVVASVEMRTSYVQAHFLARYAKDLGFHTAPGPSERIRFPVAGPYNERLGYTELPRMLSALDAAGFRITRQARMSGELAHFVDAGGFPIYREKTSAGLVVRDRHGTPLHRAQFPGRTYPDFAVVPPLVIRTLLFIENRELMDGAHPFRNPAVEWDRLAYALLALPAQIVDP